MNKEIIKTIISDLTLIINLMTDDDECYARTKNSLEQLLRKIKTYNKET